MINVYEFERLILLAFPNLLICSLENKIENKDKLKIIIDDFENVELKKVNLIYSCFSLQFCNPKKIDDLMQRITKSVYKNGFFVR